ncbi:thioredoxin [Aquihabitans sp. McL0605]|uniref:thioredoxin n=1 Tax=Aquihabitans sp. McL0605 TaxID=3415671 RepID=UPI003CF495E0
MVDVTEATFEAEIVARSHEVPVIVDLWAEWCGPCKALTPILEKVIDETDGQVVLAKVDIDANPRLAESFNVQSIPAVFAIRDGKIAGSFIGAQPEAAVRDFIEQVLPSADEQLVADLMDAGDEVALQQALVAVPGHPAATVALAELYVAEGRTDEALATLAKIPETAETRRVAALARTGAEGGDGADGPLADVEATLADLLPNVKADEDARQQFLDLLELMGPDDPRTAEWRKQLSRQMF